MSFAAYPVVVAVAFASRYLPYHPLVLFVAALSVAAGVWVIVHPKPGGAGYNIFLFIAAFFALLVVCEGSPYLVPVALVAWCVRGMAGSFGKWAAFPLRRFAMEWLAAIAILVWGGMAVSPYSALGALFLIAVCRVVAARVREAEASLAGELVACGLLVVMAGLDWANLAYLRNPLYAMVTSAAVVFFLYKAGFFGRFMALFFSFVGAVVFSTAGHEAFAFYFISAVIVEAGVRIRAKADGAGTAPAGTSDIFIPLSLLVAGISIFSTGATDPFVSYFAFAGVMCAGAFHVWSGFDYDRHWTAGNVLTGFCGASLLACSAWITSFLPAVSLPLIALSAGMALLAPATASWALSAPERDAKWLTAMAGGLAAVLLAKLVLPALYGVSV